MTINLDSTTPYVDIPVTVIDPVDATVSTTTGLSNTGHWIDSWIELWQGTNRLIFNDDGNHSNTNVLASIFTIPLQAGEYFIRATSWNYIVGGSATGSYLLSTNLVATTPEPTPSPTATEVTPEPSPSPTETVTPSPTPTQTSSSPTPEPTPEPSSPSPSPSDIPQPSESPTVPVVPGPEPDEPDPVPSVELILPSELPSPDVQDTLIEVVDSSLTDFPSSLENDLPSLEDTSEENLTPSSIDEILNLLSFLPDFSLEALQETFQQISETITAAFESIPGGEAILATIDFAGEQITAAAEFATNLGTDFTPEEREQAQQVVLGAVIVTQLSTARRIK